MSLKKWCFKRPWRSRGPPRRVVGRAQRCGRRGWRGASAATTRPARPTSASARPPTRVLLNDPPGPWLYEMVLKRSSGKQCALPAADGAAPRRAHRQRAQQPAPLRVDRRRVSLRAGVFHVRLYTQIDSTLDTQVPYAVVHRRAPVPDDPVLYMDEPEPAAEVAGHAYSLAQRFIRGTSIFETCAVKHGILANRGPERHPDRAGGRRGCRDQHTWRPGASGEQSTRLKTFLRPCMISANNSSIFISLYSCCTKTVCYFPIVFVWNYLFVIDTHSVNKNYLVLRGFVAVNCFFATNCFQLLRNLFRLVIFWEITCW